ncbi:MAG: 2-phospho-L-lactate guanylyltransferase [Xanthobacteraceae bacterium]
MYVLIPCKSFQSGKSRLSACLGEQPRRELCRDMLRHTLEYAAGAVAADNIRLLSSDTEAAAIARTYSIAAIADAGSGLNQALEAGRAALLAKGSIDDELLVLPIDLPFACAAAVREAHVREGEVVIAADQRRSGTNLLLLRAAALRHFAFRYGTDSYARHLQQARDNDFSVCELDDWRLAFDIDDAQQYAAWRSIAPAQS